MQQGEGLCQNGLSHILLQEGTAYCVLLMSRWAGHACPNIPSGTVQAASWQPAAATAFVSLPTLVSTPFLFLFPSLNGSFPPYLLCIRIGNLKLSPEWDRELVQMLTSGTAIEVNIFNVFFTTSFEVTKLQCRFYWQILTHMEKSKEPPTALSSWSVNATGIASTLG